MNTLTREYMENRIRTASPVELIVIIYEATMQFLVEARTAMETMSLEKKTNAINRASRCIAELQLSLNHEKGGEVAQNLAKLYDYCQRRLMEANIQNSLECLNEVIRLVQGLLDSWTQVAKKDQVAKEGAAPAEANRKPAEESKSISFSI